MKLETFVIAHNQAEITQCCLYELMLSQLSKDITLIDNASAEDLSKQVDFPRRIIRTERTGLYDMFFELLKHTDADIIAVFHNDMMIPETDWDRRVISEFEKNPNLGLIGFVGSDEIDAAGGRGLGTMSNFLGKTYSTKWTGSPAEAHGKRVTGFRRAAVVDGCAMIFRRSCLAAMAPKADFPPHHFYDRVLSLQTFEAGFTVGYLGIGCDHISGQTANQEQSYHDYAKQWLMDRELWVEGAGNPDNQVYLEAERRFLREYRDQKNSIPKKV